MRYETHIRRIAEAMSGNDNNDIIKTIKAYINRYDEITPDDMVEIANEMVKVNLAPQDIVRIFNTLKK